jgi:hypothetical protein
MMTQDSELHGQLFIGPDSEEPPVYETDGGHEFVQSVPEEESPQGHAESTNVYEKVLARWRDPLSPPHVRNSCAKWLKTKFPRAKVCVGWKVEYRWIYRTAILNVTVADQSDIKGIVQDCLTSSAVAAAIAAIVSGGTAAAGAAESALKACLLLKLKENLVGVSIRFDTVRGDWE